MWRPFWKHQWRRRTDGHIWGSVVWSERYKKLKQKKKNRGRGLMEILSLLDFGNCLWTGESPSTATVKSTATSVWDDIFMKASQTEHHMLFQCTTVQKTKQKKTSFKEKYWEMGLFISFNLFCHIFVKWKIVNKTFSIVSLCHGLLFIFNLNWKHTEHYGALQLLHVVCRLVTV